MSLTEYLYVDERRLESYFEQISSPLHYDQSPNWKFSLNLAGPSVETTLSKQGRQFTRHEKIMALIRHLEKNDLMEIYRPADEERRRTDKVFRLETCRAIRVHIAPEGETEFPGFGLWISYSPHPKHQNPKVSNYQAGALYLLEDFRDTDPPHPTTYSAYTALNLFCDVVGSEYSVENSTMFSSHPDKFFAALGAKIGKQRLIRTMYRIRATCNDTDGQQFGAVVTIGYPLFIAEG